MPFSADLAITSRELVLSRLEAGGYAELAGVLTLGEAPTLRASAVLSEAPIGDAYRLALGREAPPSLDGLAFASGSVSGPVGDLAGSAQLQLAGAGVGDVRGLDAVAVVSLAGGVVSVDEAEAEYLDRRFLTASGSADLAGELALTIRGEAVPGPLLGGDGRTEFGLVAGIGGTIENPNLDCRIDGERGVFLGIPFDRFAARVTGATGDLSLDRLSLDRAGSYRVTASGRTPLAALTRPGGSAEGQLTVEVDEDPLALVGSLVDGFEDASSDGRMTFHLVGDRESYVLVRGEADVRNGTLRIPGVLEELESLSLEASLVDGELTRGRLTALADGEELSIESRRSALVEGRLLEPLVVRGVDLGVLAVTTGEQGVPVRVPGLMEEGETGRATVIRRGDVGALLVAGPSEHPVLWGTLRFADTSFTYPFLSSGGGLSGDFLSRADWSITIQAGRNLWYRRPDANLKLDRDSSLDFVGVPADHTFCVAGRASSSRGTVTYLNADFDVRIAFIDFPSFCEPPRFYIEGTTRVDDGTEITLSVVAEEEAGAALAGAGTPWDESTVVLRSDSPDDATAEDALARLTYGADREEVDGADLATLERRRALEVVASQVGVAVVRPLISPVEGRIKRTLHLDLVRINVDFVEYFLYQLDLWQAQEGSGQYQPFLADTRLTLGKYIAHDWMLSYEGIAQAYEISVGEQSLVTRHEFGIEYEVSRNTSLSLKAVYDPVLEGWDRGISIENRFRF